MRINNILKSVLLVIACISLSACATDPNATDHHGLSSPQQAPTTVTKHRAYHAPKQHFAFSATVYPGSVKNNVRRILRAANWNRVIWNVPYDYNWVGQANLYGSSVQDVIGQLLSGYPLQAVFYQGNHVVVIKPRVV